MYVCMYVCITGMYVCVCMHICMCIKSDFLVTCSIYRQIIPSYIFAYIHLSDSVMAMGNHKNHGTSFCGEPVCVWSRRAMPEGAKRRGTCPYTLYNVRNYLLGFRRITFVNILVPKTQISTEDWHPCILYRYDGIMYNGLAGKGVG